MIKIILLSYLFSVIFLTIMDSIYADLEKREIFMPIQNTVLSLFYLYRLVTTAIIIPIIFILAAIVMYGYRTIKDFISG